MDFLLDFFLLVLVLCFWLTASYIYNKYMDMVTQNIIDKSKKIK